MDLNAVKMSMEKRGYVVQVFETCAQAADYLDANIKNTTVGTGGSMTLDALDILDRLEKTNTVFYRNRSKDIEDSKNAMFAPVYITSANAVTEDGVFVNLDGAGNRVAAASFCKDVLYYVIGVNKIVPTLDDAIYRTRNVAAPKNAQRLNRKTPCAAKADKCYDCNSPECICRSLSIMLKPVMTVARAEVIIINEELGY